MINSAIEENADMTPGSTSSRTPPDHWGRPTLLLGSFLSAIFSFLMALGMSLLVWSRARATHPDSAPDFIMLSILTAFPWLCWLSGYRAMMSLVKRGEIGKPALLKVAQLTLLLLLFSYLPLAISLGMLYSALRLGNPFPH